MSLSETSPSQSLLPSTLQGPSHSLKPRGSSSSTQGQPQITILVVRSGHQAGLGKLEEKVRQDYWWRGGSPQKNRFLPKNKNKPHPRQEWLLSEGTQRARNPLGSFS